MQDPSEADEPAPIWVTPAQAAAHVGIPLSAVRRWMTDQYLNDSYSLVRQTDGVFLVNTRALESIIDENKSVAYLTIGEAMKVISVSEGALLGWIEGRVLRAWKYRGRYQTTVLEVRKAYQEQRVSHANTSDLLVWFHLIIGVGISLLAEARVDLLGIVLILLVTIAWLVFINFGRLRQWFSGRTKSTLVRGGASGSVTFLFIVWITKVRRQDSSVGRPIEPAAVPAAVVTPVAAVPPLIVTGIVTVLQVVAISLTLLAPFGSGPLSRTSDGRGDSTDDTLLGAASPAPSRAATSTPTVDSTPTAAAFAASGSPCQLPTSFSAQVPTFEYPMDGQTLDFEGTYIFEVSAVPGSDSYAWEFGQNGVVAWSSEGSNNYSISPGEASHANFVPGEVVVNVQAGGCGKWTPTGTITIFLEPRSLEQAVTDQEVTEQIAVDPGECAVDPQPLDAILELSYQDSVPTADLEITRESLADEATVSAVTTILRELVACLNAGDELRTFALYTDNGLTRTFFPSGPPTQEELDSVAAPPESLAPEEQQPMPIVQEVRILADGRVGAFVDEDLTMTVGGKGTIVYVFVQVDDRWLIDEQIDISSSMAPTP